MKLTLRTRRELAVLNAQDWADFKAHWPMHLVELLARFAVATLLGLAFGLSLALWALERLA